MSLPGFTADPSLVRIGDRYWVHPTTDGFADGGGNVEGDRHRAGGFGGDALDGEFVKAEGGHGVGAPVLNRA